MAEQAGYTGAQYDASYYKQPNETLSEYMMRLAQMRAQGILGGGGMFDVKPTPQKEIAAEVPLGEVVRNQPSSGDGDGMSPVRADAQQRYEGARWMLDNPAAATLIRGVMPFGLGSLLMSDNQLEGYVRNTQNEATGSQGFFDYLFGRDGDVVLGDKGTGTGSLVTGKATDITRSMFPEQFDPMNFTSSMSSAPVPYGATTTPAGQYMDFNFNRLPSPMEQAVAMQQAQAELAARQAALGTQMQADMGMLSGSSPSDSVSAGRTSSSDISYSSARDKSSTTGYNFNKD